MILSLKLNNWIYKIEASYLLTKEVIFIGFPIMILGLALLLFGSMDRLMILKFLDTEALGIYSIGLAVASILSLIPAFSGQSFYPRMVELYGSKGICKKIIIMCIQASLISLAITSLGVILIYFLLPTFVEYFLESYTDGLMAMKIILISGLILALTAGPNYFIIASEQKIKQIGLIAFVVILIFLFSLKFSSLGLNGILWSVVAGSLAYMMGLWLIVLTSYIGQKNT